MMDRDRTFHRLMAATRRRKAEDHHAKGSARPGQSLSPHCRSQSPRSAERKSVTHVSGGFCWVKVNGPWLYKTRQIVTGRNKHPARWMLWRPNRRAQIPSALRSAKPIRWLPEDIVRPTIGVKLFLATRPSIAGESSVTYGDLTMRKRSLLFL